MRVKDNETVPLVDPAREIVTVGDSVSERDVVCETESV